MTDAKIVHLVDDDEAIRHSASFMLRHAGFQVKTYTDGVAFLEAAPTAGRGVVLLDVRMPGLDGLAVQNELTKKSIRLPVIILTGHGDVLLAVEAMKAGALDFLEKPYEKAALLSALDRAFASLRDAEMTADTASRADARLACLTQRERDVLEKLAEGGTNKQIASALEISPRTVEIHRANMMSKLNAHTLADALRIVFAADMLKTSRTT